MIKIVYNMLILSFLVNLNLYADKSNKTISSCEILSRHPSASTNNEKFKSEVTTVQKILELFNKKNYKELYKLLHPLNQSKTSERAFAANLTVKLKLYGQPQTFSNQRIWLLNTDNGSPAPIHCTEDNITIFPTYGHATQFSAWIQVLGTKDLGRIFIQLVSQNNSLKIANLTIHQWSFAGKDSTEWAKEAEQDLNIKKHLDSYLKFKLAQNILNANEYLVFPDAVFLAEKIKNIENQHKIKETVTQSIKSFDVPNMDVVMAEKNVGLLVYLRLKSQMTKPNREKECKKLGKELLDQKILEGLSGVQCNFLYPQHPATQKSPLGGIFYNVKQLEK